MLNPLAFHSCGVSICFLLNFLRFDNLLIWNTNEWNWLKTNQNIIYCLAKIVKSSVIKERTGIILCKINVRRIFVSSDCKKYGWLIPKETNRYRLLFGIAMLYFIYMLYSCKVSVREKIYHIFHCRRNSQITSTIKAGRYALESDIYQPICQYIYQPICRPICHADLITLLPQHHCPATTTSLPCYGNIIVLLRQYHCPATAISFCCCLKRWVDYFRSWL